MRDYLYIWNDPINQCITISGIEFRDLVGRVGTAGGLILLAHDATPAASYIRHSKRTMLDYVASEDIHKLAQSDIYTWGDFVWTDYTGEDFPSIADHEIAELLFFAHLARPLGRTALPSVGNKYLCHIHDDGWLLQLFYASWEDVTELVGSLCPILDTAKLRTGNDAYWVSGETVDIEQIAMNMDTLLNRRIDR